MDKITCIFSQPKLSVSIVISNNFYVCFHIGLALFKYELNWPMNIDFALLANMRSRYLGYIMCAHFIHQSEEELWV